MAEGKYDWLKALAPLATTLIPMMARGGNNSGMSGMPPEFSQLLQQQVQQNASQQPMREAAQGMAFSMLPSWARGQQGMPGQQAQAGGTDVSGYTIPGDSGGGMGGLGRAGAGLSLAGKFLPAAAGIPFVGPAMMGADAVVRLARHFGGNSTNRTREDFAKQFTGTEDREDAMGSFWPWLQQRVRPETYQQLYHTAANVIGRNDSEANRRWMQDVLNAVQGGR